MYFRETVHAQPDAAFDHRLRLSRRRQLPRPLHVGEQIALNQAPLVRVRGKGKAAVPVGHEFVSRSRLYLAAIEEEQLLKIQSADLAAKGIQQGEQLFLAFEKHG